MRNRAAVISAAALAGSALALAGGCTYFRSNPQGRWAESSTPKAQPVSGVQTPAAASQTHGLIGHDVQHAPVRRGFDPLWIESAAAAERNKPGENWSPYSTNVNIGAGHGPNTAHGVLGTPVAAINPQAPSDPHALVEPGSMIDDGPEGLKHVTTAAQGADFDPQVSRDGRFMVFASTQHRATSDIYIKRVDGRTVTQLTANPAQDVMPAISPDGERVAFTSNRRGNWDIFVMSAKGGQALQLTSEHSHELHPSWSPDGKSLVFCRLGETSGRWELWVVDATGSGGNEFVGYGLFPEWCPVAGTGESGRDRILFQRSRERGDRAFSIWTIDYKPGDTSSPTEIASDPSAALINATWSPDGQFITYATVTNPNASAYDTASGRMLAQSELWMTSVDGTARVALTAGKHLNLQPTWAGDGRIYFVSDRSGVNNVWSLGTEQALAAAGAMRNDATAESETTQETTQETTEEMTETADAEVEETPEQ